MLPAPWVPFDTAARCAAFVRRGRGLLPPASCRVPPNWAPTRQHPKPRRVSPPNRTAYQRSEARSTPPFPISIQRIPNRLRSRSPLRRFDASSPKSMEAESTITVAGRQCWDAYINASKRTPEAGVTAYRTRSSLGILREIPEPPQALCLRQINPLRCAGVVRVCGSQTIRRRHARDHRPGPRRRR